MTHAFRSQGFRFAGHQTGYEEIAHRDKSEQEEVSSATLIIEVVRECRDKQQPGRGATLQQQIYQNESGEQPKEDTATEYHRCLRVVAQESTQLGQVYIKSGKEFVNIPHNRYRLLRELDKTIFLAADSLRAYSAHGRDASIRLPSN